MTREQSPQQPYWTFWRVVWATLVLVSLGVSFWLLYRFRQVVFILFIALVLGTVLRPAVARLQRWGIRGTIGVALVYLLLLALLIGFGLLLFPVIIEQGATIVAVVPDYYQSLREWVADHPNLMIASLGEFLPPTLALPSLVPETGQEILESAGEALGYVALAADVAFTAVSVLLLAAYWTLDGPRIIHSFLLLVPRDRRESIGELVAAMETKVSAYFAGQAILMLVVGGMALIAYWLIGLPYVLVLALAAGVMEAVPLIGPLLGAIPAALVALTLGPNKLIWVIIATLVIQQLENSILVPRVMRKAVGVNPFVSLLALFAFSSLLGIAGALMAIPIAVIIQIILDRFVFQRREIELDALAGRNYASLLRYEAQDLAQDLRKQARMALGGSEQMASQMAHMMDEIESIATDLDLLLARAESRKPE